VTDPITRLKGALAAKYEIDREIGAGGMATVFLAKDLRHDRQVALKLLRPELGAVIGAERFLAEIRTTAKLQHPHILPLFDSGEADGLLFYVMPYVEGISLRECITREKQLSVSDAVRIASEIASALDYAHRHGVIHRDIKPENILLHDKQALVADFGIALALSNAGSTRMTETGMSLGTPHYMSPEQAMGERDITAASDVYALGAITYEMLVGEPPFTGPTAQAIVARVVTEQPRPLIPKRHTIPAHIEAAVLTALEKVPADRFATAADFAAALRNTSYTGARASASSKAFAGKLGPAGRYPLLAAAMLALAVGAAAFAIGRSSGNTASTAPTSRFVITTPPDQRLTGFANLNVAISPDGRSIVYAGQDTRNAQLFLRKLDDLSVTAIPGTERSTDPSFSVDGKWIVFTAGNQLYKISVAGGSPIPLGVTDVSPATPVMLYGDHVFATNNGGSLLRFSANGKPVVLAKPDSAKHEVWLYLSDILPGGKKGLMLSIPGGTSNGKGYLIDLESGERSLVMDDLIGNLSYDDGYLVWVQRDGTMLAAPFDGKKVTGTPVTLAQGVRYTVGGPPQFAMSKSGTIIYIPETPFQLTLVDRAGKFEQLVDLERRFHSPRVSPDGKYVAVDFTQQNSRDVWTLNLRDKTLSRLTFEKDGHDPVWSTDGKKIAYASGRNGVIGMFMRNADGSGSVDSINVTATAQTVGAFASSDEIIVLNTSVDGTNDLYKLSLTKRGQPTPYLASSYNEFYPAVSPNGRWLAYVSDESGQNEVYVRPLAGEGAKVLVSQNGGGEPAWSRDGRELFYLNFGANNTPMMAASVESGAEFKVLDRKQLFSVNEYEGATPHTNYDVTADGRFVMVHQGKQAEIVVIQNWKDEVKRRSAANR
jgi:serine/threonine-protein kinase